jgi:hypothetical protein
VGRVALCVERALETDCKLTRMLTRMLRFVRVERWLVRRVEQRVARGVGKSLVTHAYAMSRDAGAGAEFDLQGFEPSQRTSCY